MDDTESKVGDLTRDEEDGAKSGVLGHSEGPKAVFAADGRAYGMLAGTEAVFPNCRLRGMTEPAGTRSGPFFPAEERV